MFSADDTTHQSTKSCQRIVIASRGTVDASCCQLVRNLPLLSSNVLALNVRQRETATAVQNTQADAEDIETLHREGKFVREVVTLAAEPDVSAVVLLAHGGSRRAETELAKDACAVLRRTRKAVLAVPAECSLESRSGVLVAACGKGKNTRLTDCCVDQLVDLAGTEAVVLSVKNPFWPMFSRTAVGMRSEGVSALKEVHDEQAKEAEDEAACLCERLRSCGAKSWAVGKVGESVPMIQEAAQSTNSSLICIQVDRSDMQHERRLRAFLTNLITTVPIPVLILPPASSQ